MIASYFKFRENETKFSTEICAGATTFLTMAYIIFLQPAILSRTFTGEATGLDFGAVMLATCLAAALATALMGILANYPIAQAPGMGENFFFVTVIMSLGAAGVANAWQVALGIVFIAGVIFLILSLLRVRKAIINALSPSMKNAIAVGIGLFIAFIGLQKGGLIKANPGTMVAFNPDLLHGDPLIFFFGLFLIAALSAKKVPGAIIIGILATAVFALCIGRIEYQGLIGLPQVRRSALLKMDLGAALSVTALPFIVIFLFMDMFDTVGTLIGVGEQAGLIKDNRLPRANRALVSDAVGTVCGACLGTSTVTSYIESTAGVAQGGRTGFTSLITAALFLCAVFIYPLVSMIGENMAITAPALVVVGTMMLRNVTKIDWEDYSETIPAFLVIVGIPLTYSIADGIALGFISYPIIKFLSGRGRMISWLMYLMAGILILYLIFVRAGIAG